MTTTNGIQMKSLSKKDLLDNIKNMSNKQELKEKTSKITKIKKIKEKKEVKPRRTLNLNRRLRRDDLIKLDIEPDDDVMVSLIKQNINTSGLCMADIYNILPDSKAYNLFYGLATRNSMALSTFEMWCNILDLDYTIQVKKKPKIVAKPQKIERKQNNEEKED